jgi:hypothetical protein
MSLAVAAPPRLGLAQGSLPHPGVPLLYMSAGLQEVGLWDVLDGRCHQVRKIKVDGVLLPCVCPRLPGMCVFMLVGTVCYFAGSYAASGLHL